MAMRPSNEWAPAGGGSDLRTARLREASPTSHPPEVPALDEATLEIRGFAPLRNSAPTSVPQVAQLRSFTDPRWFDANRRVFHSDFSHLHDFATYNASIGSYLSEVLEIARLPHPFRKGRSESILSGVGLYSEMGADIVPLLATRNYGRLVGMSLNEAELYAASAMRTGFYGVSEQELFGQFVSDGIVDRDALQVVGQIGHEALEVQRRLKQGYLSFLGNRGTVARAMDIDANDWCHYGRQIDWEHFTFLPSAAGDAIVLQSFLQGSDVHRFDHLWLKGTHQFAFGGNGADYRDWLEVLDRYFLASDATVLVSELDAKVAVPWFVDHGYLDINFAYSRGRSTCRCDSMPICSDGAPNELAGAPLYAGRDHVQFSPRGNFTILVKDPR